MADRGMRSSWRGHPKRQIHACGSARARYNITLNAPMYPVSFTACGLPRSASDRFPDRLDRCAGEIPEIYWYQISASEVSMTYDVWPILNGNVGEAHEHLFRVIAGQIYEVLQDGTTLPVHEKFVRHLPLLRYRRGQHLNDLIHHHSRVWFSSRTVTVRGIE